MVPSIVMPGPPPPGLSVRIIGSGFVNVMSAAILITYGPLLTTPSTAKSLDACKIASRSCVSVLTVSNVCACAEPAMSSAAATTAASRTFSMTTPIECDSRGTDPRREVSPMGSERCQRMYMLPRGACSCARRAVGRVFRPGGHTSVRGDAHDAQLIESQRAAVAREDDEIVDAGRERAGEVEPAHQELAAEQPRDIRPRDAIGRGSDKDRCAA